MIGGGRPQGTLRRRGGAGVLARRGPRGARSRQRFARIPRPGPRVLVALVLVLALLGGIWMWLRDSSLVAVKRVQVTGASGPDAAQIRGALVSAARNMTTLHVKMNQLRNAVGPYPIVKSISVSTQFPHGMRIRVIEQAPVAIVAAGGHEMAVAGDGTLLHDVSTTSSLPTISLGVVPGGTHVTGYALTEVHLLAAAPYQLLARVSQVSDGAAHGLVAQLHDGPSLYFGDATKLGAKWTAAAEVLADQGSAGASYIDVTIPGRPTAGAGADSAATSTGASSGSTSAQSGSGSPSGGSTGAPTAPTSSPSGSGSTVGG